MSTWLRRIVGIATTSWESKEREIQTLFEAAKLETSMQECWHASPPARGIVVYVMRWGYVPRYGYACS